MLSNRRKVFLLLALIGFVALLSGCTQINQPISVESTGVWNKYFVYPMSWLITYFAELFNNNYGLAIVVVTLLARFVLVPLNVKQLRSSKAMQDIQPELKKVQAKYSSKDANTQKKLQEETMELFKKNGVNPIAGCLPIFVQMPILIAMYHAIMRTTEIKQHSFLWFELGATGDLILPILAGAATFLQQKLMMSGSPASQNPQMMVMLYVMPIMITVFAFFFPAALALYWVVGNIFMVVQTILIRKPMMKKDSIGGEK